MKTFSMTHIGRRREMNQDYMYTSENAVGKLPNLFLVADGMGGHKAGEYASRFTVEKIVETIETSGQTEPVAAMKEAVEAANRGLLEEAGRDAAKAGMGTTVVAATVIGDHLHVANVGDSRLYLINHEAIRQITRDHSLVEEMVRLGEMDKADAKDHPDKNIITRAVGVVPELSVDFFEVELKPGDTVLMCSDGLTNMIEDEEIKKIVLGQRGTGGMSDVYKAKDHTLGRVVAIKVLKPEFSEDVNFVTKFRTEAQSAAGLEHPNIVNIYDVGSENGMHYIVMEYVEGITLKTYIEKKGQLTFKEAVSIAIQVGRGIEAAHNKGIIHRDIKPQNIIISTEGKVKVTDFGIARAATSNTISSDVMGSVHYASPEQARNGFVDGKSDIYSLGIVMYEMVTGRVPFDGDTTVAVAIQHLQEEIVPPSAYAPNLPISMEKIILKCTQKNPDRRYESMTALLADLRKALISPNEDFVVIAPVSQEKTRVIGEEEINKIKQETSNIYLSDEDVVSHNQNHRDKFEKRDRFEEDDEDDEEAYDDDELEEMNPKMDKAITIMGIAAGVIIVALIIFILVSFFGDFKFGGSSNKANTETSETQTDGIEVPDLKGLTFDEAKEQLNAKGLGIKKNAGTVASDQYDEGQIVSQTPDALTKAEANTTVEVTLSSGKGEVSVPSVTGMDETTAYNTLTNSGFTPVKDYAYSADVAQGNVIEQSPNAGSLAKAGDNVKIVISRGKEQAETTSVAVPGVTGLTEDAARSAIQNVGLAVGNVSSAYSDSVASGQIISQSPVADTAVDAGTAVDFVVSMGAEPAQEVKPTTYKINLNIKKPNNESVAAANIYLYDGADGTGNILEQWTNQSISLFGEEGLSISKSGMLASSGSLKIDWLGADGQQLGSSQIVSPISFKAE